MRLISLSIVISTYRGLVRTFPSRIASLASDAASNWSTVASSASADIVLGPAVSGSCAVAAAALASAWSRSATFS